MKVNYCVLQTLVFVLEGLIKNLWASFLFSTLHHATLKYPFLVVVDPPSFACLVLVTAIEKNLNYANLEDLPVDFDPNDVLQESLDYAAAGVIVAARRLHD